MVKKILVTCGFIGFLLIMIPTIPAIEYSALPIDYKISFHNKINTIESSAITDILDGGLGVLELFIALLLFIYIQLGIIFNRSFTLILLLANLLYDLGVLFGLIDSNIIS